ncbi:enoyl-CoA hydratase/isomerase family protein [Microbaculum marinum]|uniref:Enoyl-CoA hydratase/isomerase family protein n=1 Tax=Microbaculum marinum TaxID=1764581 RepID=A0AAW9RXP8_9HYPH
MELETCRLDVAEGIATVTLARPPVNAQNRRMRDEMIWLFDSLSDRDDVRVVILTAEGKVFSAGADIKERRTLVKQPGDYLDHNRVTREFFFGVADCTKPVIAAVNGAAIGAGCALMLYCDIVLMSEDAFIRMPEIDVGMAGGMRLMTEHFGRSMARQIYFTGRDVPAAELYRLGVVSACVPGGRLMDEAMEIARQIAAKSPMVVKLIKRGFEVAEGLPFRDAYRYEQSITHDLSKTDVTKEAQTAFVEKRKADVSKDRP